MSSISERVYLKSPVWLQKVAVATYGYWWYRQRFNKYFFRFVEQLSDNERLSSEEYLALQEVKLKHLLERSRKSPYYRRVFEALDVDFSESPFDILSRLPLLAKETLRTSGNQLITISPVPKGTRVFRSSGSTGTPVEIYYTPEFHAFELAAPEVRSLRWAKTDYQSRRVMFGARKVCAFEQDEPPFWRISPVENMAYASIYHLSPQFIPHYLEFLRDYKPELITGFPSALLTVANFALEHGEWLPPPKAIITTSEALTDLAKLRIQKAWNCRVYERYGAVEGCVLATECEKGRLHISPEVGIVEILNSEGEPVEPGETGELVCTGLENTLQPLLRYRIGDMAQWAKNQRCECGRTMPVIESIEGRVEDLCYTRDGRQILRFDSVFKGVRKIREAQVVQEAIDLFAIRVVTERGFGDREERQLEENVKLYIGDVRVDVQKVDQIDRGSSGKFEAVRCKLTKEEKLLLKQANIDGKRSRG